MQNSFFSRVLPFVPVVTALLTFGATLRYGFIWDDPMVLEQLRAFHSLGDLFVLPDAVPKFYYRPLIFLTFLFDRALGGETPYWFHFSAIFWHAVASGLVFVFARRILGERHAIEACFAATLFAVHPVRVESVAWIAGRSDVVASALLLCVLLLAAKREQFWTSWAAGGIFLLALFSKETALAALILVPLADLCLARRLVWSRYVPLLFATGIYFALRNASLGTTTGGFATGQPSPIVIKEIVAAIGWYVQTWVAPVRLIAYVPDVPVNAATVALGILAIGAGAIGAAIAWRREKRALTFLVLWFFITLAPSLVVILRRSASAQVAERYLYLPSIGVVILLGWCLVRIRSSSPSGAKLGAAGAVCLCAVAMGLSVARNPVWADEVAFWSDVADKSGDYMLPHRELGDAYLRREQLDLAEKAMSGGIGKKGEPEDRVMLHNNLGNLYFRKEKLDEAARQFEAGRAIHPHPYLFSGLGRVAMRRAELAQKRGDQSEVVRQVVAARDALQQALALDPNNDKNHALLGQVLLSLGDRRGAQEHLERSLELQPSGKVAETSRQFLKRIAN